MLAKKKRSMLQLIKKTNILKEKDNEEPTQKQHIFFS